jgi:hypothetical protein
MTITEIGGSSEHTGVIKKGYKDPHLWESFPVTAWCLK